MRDLRGRTAIVTGAAGGLGAAFSAALAGEGVSRQALVDTDEVGLGRVADTLEGLGCSVMRLAVDVADRESVLGMVGSVIEEFGGVDLLLNVAGVGVMAPVEALDPADWDTVLGTDLLGTINTTSAVYSHMVSRRGGHIVNVSSSSGLFIPVLYLSPYAAAKFAVVGFSEALMLEAAVHGINVTCVCPGNVRTGIHSTTPIKGFSEGARDLVLKSLAIAERPESTARSMVKAVKKGRFLVVTTPFARSAYFVRRHAPGLYFAVMRRFAPAQAKAFDEFRQGPDTGL